MVSVNATDPAPGEGAGAARSHPDASGAARPGGGGAVDALDLADAAATQAGGGTRERIVASALRLFGERGYDRTTMRAIAADAELSVGNAYYYFASKEHLIQGFYTHNVAEHHRTAAPLLAEHVAFADRLVIVLGTWVDVSQPYHAFATQFFRHAADPTSPMSPFSDESGPTRDASTDIMRAVIDGSDLVADPELLRRLPRLLWLAQMGIVLFWVYDRTDDAARTRLLIERAVPLIDRLLRLSRLRALRPLVRQTLQLLDDLGLPG